MALRPYAAAKRTLSATDKLGEVNWGLLLLICLIAIAGIAMLYSVAGARFQPWALRQMGHFTLGLIVLLAAALIDIRMWMSLAYPAYGIALLLLVAVDVVGHVGLGAQRWISIGPLDLQPSELMKIALILALARFLHGKSIEEVSKPIPLAIGLAMIGIPAVFVVLQPNLGTTLGTIDQLIAQAKTGEINTVYIAFPMRAEARRIYRSTRSLAKPGSG